MIAGIERAAEMAVFVIGIVGVTAGWRARRAVRAARLAARLAHERETALALALRRIADAARTSLDDVRAALDRAVREISPAVDALAFFDEREGALVCVAVTGARLEHYAGSVIARDDVTSPVARAALTARRALFDGTPPLRAIHPADRAVLAVPVPLDDGRSAVVAVASRRALAAEAVERLVVLIDTAAAAYRLASERDADRRRAAYDGLTGLLTPQAFRRQLAAACEAARRDPLARLALLFIDTDHFKTWNDTFGHASGDALLRAIADRLRRAASGPGDLAARNGGDEFCVVFNETEKAAAIARAEGLRRAIAELDVDALRPPGATARVRISASIGVAAFPADARDAQTLLEGADAAMYHAKRSGRDAVAFAGVDGTLTRADEALCA